MASEPPFAERPENEFPQLPSIEGLSATRSNKETPEAPSVIAAATDYPVDLLPRRSPPQPGFWLAALATLLMVCLSQIAIPGGVLIIWIIGRAILFPHANTGSEELQSQVLAPLVALGQVSMMVLGLITLRLFAGREWRREVALRLPSYKHLVLALIGFPALPILASGAQFLAAVYIPGLANILRLIFSQVVMVGALGFVWLVVRSIRNRDPKPDLAGSPLPVQGLVAALLAGVAILAAIGGYQLAAQFIPPIAALGQLDKQMEEFVQNARSWTPWLAVLIVAGCPALSEELWCRAFLGRGLVGQYGLIPGILISSYFFGAMHVLPHQATMAMLMGIVLHYAYVTTRSLFVPMLLHFLNNACVVLGEELSKYVGRVVALIDTAPQDIPLTLYAVSGVLATVVGYALFRSRARPLRLDCNTAPPWEPAFPGVALPPSSSGTTIDHPSPGLVTWGLVAGAFASFVAAFFLIAREVPIR